MKSYAIKYFLVVFACFALIGNTLATPGVLSGTITNCTGGAASGATVKLLGTNIAPVTTNAAGAYSFSIEQSLYHVQVYKATCGARVQNNVNVGAATTLNLTPLPKIHRIICAIGGNRHDEQKARHCAPQRV